MSDVAKTPREELECKKKYLYEYSMFFECNDGSKCQILEDDVCDLLNGQQNTIQSLQDLCGKSDYENAKLRIENKKLKEENEQLRQKIKHCVYVDVDNGNGCMNCKYGEGSICSILNCGTHDYLEGVSECGLKYWGYKDE